MAAINIHKAKTQFSKLLQRVAAGEEITIANRGVPVARLVPVAQKPITRRLGVDVGRARIHDDFDAPLPPEILAGFYGGPIDEPKRKPVRTARTKVREAS